MFLYVTNPQQQEQQKAFKLCVASEAMEQCCFLAGSALEKCPGLSQISKACVPELLLNMSKVESTVCNCVCVLFCGAPADLLLLFLPPGPKADRLSKHSLPQQWTDSLMDTCILGKDFICYWINYRMPVNIIYLFMDCISLFFVFFLEYDKHMARCKKWFCNELTL